MRTGLVWCVQEKGESHQCLRSLRVAQSSPFSSVSPSASLLAISLIANPSLGFLCGKIVNLSMDSRGRIKLKVES